MAISLMNDSSYAYDVAGNLLSMARVVFFHPSDAGGREVEESLVLDAAEINEMLEESTKETGES